MRLHQIFENVLKIAPIFHHYSFFLIFVSFFSHTYMHETKHDTQMSSHNFHFHTLVRFVFHINFLPCTRPNMIHKCLPQNFHFTHSFDLSSAQNVLHRNVFHTILPEQKCLPHKMSCTEMSSTPLTLSVQDTQLNKNVLHRKVTHRLSLTLSVQDTQLNKTVLHRKVNRW